MSLNVFPKCNRKLFKNLKQVENGNRIMVKTLPWMLCEKLGYNDCPVKIIQAWTCVVTVEMEILGFMLVSEPQVLQLVG